MTNPDGLMVFFEVDLDDGDVGRGDTAYSGGLGERAGPKGRELLLCLRPEMGNTIVIQAQRYLFALKMPVSRY